MSHSLSYATRRRVLSGIEDITYDLLVLGGGINGAGVAREAALRGMKVLLTEQRDFAAGTSSRSSKMIHGGIRYLENLEFGLVFESLSERSKLFDLAPHLVHPLKFFLPVYQRSRHPMWKLSLGMWLYDVLSLFDAPETHERLSASEAIRLHPYLQTSGLKGGFSYYDAYTDDDRLVLETLRSAASASAHILNYCRCEPSLIRDEQGLMQASLFDEMGNKSYRVRARHVISSLGPWTDQFAAESHKDWTDVLRPTKGIHLVFDRAKLPLKQAVVMSDDQKGRIVFVLPRADYLLVGTTDTDFAGDPGRVVAESADVDYLLSMTSEYFPGAKLRRSDALSCYAGIRPLYADGSASETKTSREHKIFSGGKGVTVITGGKFTTYRGIAQEAVDIALREFPLGEQVRFQHSYSEQPLNPRITRQRYAAAFRQASRWAEELGVPEDQMEKLVRRYGEEAYDLVFGASESARSSSYGLLQAEVRFAIRHMGCMTPLDFLTRRSPLFLNSPDHGASVWEVIIDVFRQEMNLSDSDLDEYKQQFEDLVADEFAALNEI